MYKTFSFYQLGYYCTVGMERRSLGFRDENGLASKTNRNHNENIKLILGRNERYYSQLSLSYHSTLCLIRFYRLLDFGQEGSNI